MQPINGNTSIAITHKALAKTPMLGRATTSITQPSQVTIRGTATRKKKNMYQKVSISAASFYQIPTVKSLSLISTYLRNRYVTRNRALYSKNSKVHPICTPRCEIFVKSPASSAEPPVRSRVLKHGKD